MTSKLARRARPLGQLDVTPILNLLIQRPRPQCAARPTTCNHAQLLRTAGSKSNPPKTLRFAFYLHPAHLKQLNHRWLGDFAISLQLAHVRCSYVDVSGNPMKSLLLLFMSGHDAAHDAALFGLSPLDCCWLTMLHLICSRCFRHFSELLLNSVRGLAIYNNIILLLLIN